MKSFIRESNCKHLFLYLRLILFCCCHSPWRICHRQPFVVMLLEKNCQNLLYFLKHVLFFKKTSQTIQFWRKVGNIFFLGGLVVDHSQATAELLKLAGDFSIAWIYARSTLFPLPKITRMPVFALQTHTWICWVLS